MRRARRILALPVAAALLGGLVLGGAVPAAATPSPAPTPDRQAGAARAPGDPVPGPVVLIGTGGLRWEDVGEDTPALWSMLSADSVGVLAVRSVRPTTCPVDGWLAVSSGRRAADTARSEGGPACAEPPALQGIPGGPATVPRWDAYRAAADAASFDAEPGLLGDTLAAARTRVAAVGPGAAIALAVPSPDGRTAQVTPAWPGRVDGAAGTVDPTLLADDVQQALATDPDLLVVDAGAVRDPGDQPDDAPALTGAFAADRGEQVDRLDQRIGLVLGQLPPDATVLVASIADRGATSQLQLLAARGPAAVPGDDGATRYAASLLGTDSTRQEGIAQTTDVTPTLLAALGIERPGTSIGAPLRPIEPGGDVLDRLQKLEDVDRAASAMHVIVPWFFQGLILAQVLLYGLATLVLRRGRGDSDPAATAGRRRTLAALRRTAVVFAAVPAATFLANLVPWWRFPLPGLAVTAVVVAFVVPISALALAGPWRDRLLGPFGAVGGVTAAVLAADVATGSNLMLSSLMGVQPVVAGRWYGFSNPGFALFATGALLLAIAVADAVVRAGSRRRAAALVAGIGLLATVIDGTPGLGSDFGGPPAIVPAFAVLALLVAGVRITVARVALIALATVAVLAGLSVLDWLRPDENRTHLGRFVQTMIDGGAWQVILRKGRQNLEILLKPISVLLPFAIAFVALVLARPVAWGVRPLQLAYDRSPVLRHGLIAFAVMLTLGFALNDSGAAVPAVAATVLIPLLIAVSVRALELDDEARLDAAVARARRPAPRR